MHIYTDSVLSLLSVPTFFEPEHLKVETLGDSIAAERLVEYAGRLCYMSQKNPANRTTREYLANVRGQGHGSVFEHANYSVLIEGVSRSFTHELVRHRAGFAYSQLSQRYVDESDVAFVVPPAVRDAGNDSMEYVAWHHHCWLAQLAYAELSNKLFARYDHITDKVHRRKTAREAARSVLPNSTETKIVVTANVRAWRTMLELRASEGAEREMRRFAVKVLVLLKGVGPGFFDDFEVYMAESDGHAAARTTNHKV